MKLFSRIEFHYIQESDQILIVFFFILSFIFVVVVVGLGFCLIKKAKRKAFSLYSIKVCDFFRLDQIIQNAKNHHHHHHRIDPPQFRVILINVMTMTTTTEKKFSFTFVLSYDISNIHTRNIHTKTHTYLIYYLLFFPLYEFYFFYI